MIGLNTSQHLVISCSLSRQSRSYLLATRLCTALAGRELEHELLDLREIPLPFCDAESCWDDPNVKRVSAAIRSSATVSIAAPVHNYGVGAAARNLLAVTGDAFKHRIIGLLTASGGPRSYMAMLGLANSLILDFRTLIVPEFVCATGASFENERLGDADVEMRIERLAEQLARLTTVFADSIPT